MHLAGSQWEKLLPTMNAGWNTRVNIKVFFHGIHALNFQSFRDSWILPRPLRRNGYRFTCLIGCACHVVKCCKGIVVPALLVNFCLSIVISLIVMCSFIISNGFLTFFFFVTISPATHHGTHEFSLLNSDLRCFSTVVQMKTLSPSH